MTEAQKAHAQGIADDMWKRILIKYEAGQKEHGGNLWDNHPLDIADMAIDEVVDQAVYILTLKTQLAEALMLIEDLQAQLDRK